MRAHLVIAIDGPAGSGKSTVAKRVAEALGCTLLDTGAIYRSLALLAREAKVPWTDGARLAQLAAAMQVTFQPGRVLLDGRDVTTEIRAPEISMDASQVSALPEVRAALLEHQRTAACRGPLVAEGRDMGTVVFPDAPVKVFLRADPSVRARRRQLELAAANRQVSLEQVLSEQNRRDTADASRAVAPLRPAADATIIDTSEMSVDEVVDAVLALARALPGGGR
jgi:cytidylate kinase